MFVALCIRHFSSLKPLIGIKHAASRPNMRCLVPVLTGAGLADLLDAPCGARRLVFKIHACMAFSRQQPAAMKDVILWRSDLNLIFIFAQQLLLPRFS